MELISKTVPVNFNLFLFGDTHLGNSHVSHSGLHRVIDMVNCEYVGCTANYAVHFGDAIESILVNDPRYRPDNCKDLYEDDRRKFPTVFKQMDDAEGLLKPIRGNLVTILKGNHEDKLWAVGNITRRITDTLKVPYGSFACKVAFHDKRGNLLFKGFFEHGRKSISSTADDPRRREENMRLILKRQLKEKAGDCVLMAKGHTHRLLVVDPTPRLYLRDDGHEIKDSYTQAAHTDRYIPPDDRWYVNTGGFMRLYKAGEESYAELADYDPMELGFAIVRVRDRVIQGIDKVTI